MGVRWPAALLAMALAAPAGSAPPPDLKLCRDVAAQIRAHPQMVEPDAQSGLFERAAASHRQSVDARSHDAYVAALAAEYKPDAKLLSAIGDQVDFQDDEVWSLPGSDVHALTSTSGSASCSQFVFFEAGRELPDPPPSMQGGMNDDRAGQIFECYHSRGDLARIGGQIVFATTDVGFENDGVGFRIMPLVNRHWDKGCGIDAEFTVLYRLTEAHVAKDGPIGRAALAKLAPQIAAAKDAAEKGKRSFAFGPPVAGHAALLAAVETEKHAPAGPFPLFGDKGDAFDMSGEIFPTIIGGRDYLLSITHPTVGWRDMPGYWMVFYVLEAGQPVAVASAVIDAKQGPLSSVMITPLRP